jgi:hypothetical protein
MQTYKLFEGDTVLLAQPLLISILGRTGATFLNQIHYWIKKNNVGVTYEGQNWIYNTAKQWGGQICLSERQIRHYIKKFSAMGIILVKKLKAKSYDRTNYITINYEALKRSEISKILTPLQTAVPAESKRKKPRVLYTKITNKENNKSKGKGDKKIDRQDVSSPSHAINQVEQVENIRLNPNKVISNKNTEQHSQHNEPFKRTTAQDMLDLLQKTFPNVKSLMDKNLARNLVAAFNHKFSKNMIIWKNYLERLQSSNFIMSSDFILTIDWILKFKTIDRILNGGLGVKDIPVKIDDTAQQQKAYSHVESVVESEVCKNFRRSMIKAIGAISYNSWFKQVMLSETRGKIQMKVENQFINDQINQRFGDPLKLHEVETCLSLK